MSMLRYREQNILKLVILGQFRPFTPLKTPKNKILKKWKNFLEISSFYTCNKNRNLMYGSWDMEWDRQNFLLFWIAFCPFIPLWTQKIKILRKLKKKKKKKTWRNYHFAQVSHRWQSYDVWLLRYEVWQTEFFVILDCFLPFYPPNNPKN